LKSIRGKILFWFLTTVIVTFFLLGAVIYKNLNDTVVPLVEEMSLEILNGRSEQLADQIEAMENELKVFAESDIFIKGDIAEIEAYLAERIKSRKDRYEMLFYANKKGESVNSLREKTDISQRDYFKNVISGKKEFEVSDPIVSKVSGENIIVISMPVKNSKGEITGVSGATVFIKTLSLAAGSIKVGNEGYGFIVDGKGLLIAHPDENAVLNINLLESNEIGYVGLAEMGKKMIKGEEGFQEVTTPEGVLNFNFFMPINNTPNWSLGVAVPLKQLRSSADSIIQGIIYILLFIVLIMFLMSLFIGNRISKPIKALSLKIIEFGKGDLTVKFPVKGRDETAIMAQSLNTMADSLRKSMEEIKLSSDNINNSSDALEELADSSSRHSLGLVERSGIVDNNVQNTSASIEEVTSSVEEVAASAQNVSKVSQELSENSNQTAIDAKHGEEAMIEMVDMIKEADNQTSGTAKMIQVLAEQARSVQEIVDSISSIAEQTNLLALNAAIEAARAGEAGKGFAVVADEIRKLAEESKDSAGNIEKILKDIGVKSEGANKAASLTSESVIKVNAKANETLEQFRRILKSVEGISNMVENLAGSAEEQSASAEEMAAAMDQSAKSTYEISEQVQGINDMTAASLEEAEKVKNSADNLKALSESLEKTVDKFKIV